MGSVKGKPDNKLFDRVFLHCLLVHLETDFFQKSWHNGHDCRVHFPEQVADIFYIIRKIDTHSGAEIKVHHHPLKDMGQW